MLSFSKNISEMDLHSERRAKLDVVNLVKHGEATNFNCDS
jgi:hypothetical protein